MIPLERTLTMSSPRRFPQRRRIRVLVCLLVLSGHVAFVWLMQLHRSRSDEPLQQRENALTVVLVQPRQAPVSVRLPSPEMAVASPKVLTPTDAPAVASGAEQSPSPSQAPHSIDWQGELERAAKEVAAAVPKEQLRLPCREPRKFGDPPQTDCRPPPKLTEWEPEPPLGGIAGGLPFVRLGKRCAIGLGFFACGVGELPKPNGEVFKSMDDPDRPRSSVPDDPR